VEAGGAHSGERALHLVRAPDTRGEVGLNRAWKPGSGDRGAMAAAPQGGFRFWYKAVAAQPPDALTVQVIPMNRQPVEVGGHRVIWRVPADAVGDGQWHEGRVAYDLRDVDAVAWVQVGARVQGQVGDLWLDDIEWLPTVGPVLQVGPLAIRETPGREGEEGLLTGAILNLGDQEAAGVRCALELPQGLSTAGGPAGELTVRPGGRAEVSWALRGRRDQPNLRLQLLAEMPGQRVAAVLPLVAADLVAAGLRCSRMLLQTGAAVTVELLAREAGPVIVPNVAGQLTAPASLRVEPLLTAGDVRPGLDCVVSSWRVTALAPTPLAWLSARLGPTGDPIRTPLTVVSRLPLEAPALPEARLTAAVSGDRAVVGSQRARLVLAREASGWSTGLLQAHLSGQWREVAVLPRLGLLAGPDSEVPLCATQALAESSGDEARLRLSGQATAAGTTWTLEWELSARPDRDLIGFSLRATATGPAEVSALDGAVLYAGEGSPAVRRDAILPGLEWLVEGEASSNALDIRPEHPDRVRYVPHPYKVTVPAVGVTVGGAVVGL